MKWLRATWSLIEHITLYIVLFVLVVCCLPLLLAARIVNGTVYLWSIITRKVIDGRSKV